MPACSARTAASPSRTPPSTSRAGRIQKMSPSALQPFRSRLVTAGPRPDAVPPGARPARGAAGRPAGRSPARRGRYRAGGRGADAFRGAGAVRSIRAFLITLRLPSVSSTTAATRPGRRRPIAQGGRTSARVTRCCAQRPVQEAPRCSNSVGSDFTQLAEARGADGEPATSTAGRPAGAKATRPSTRATDLLSSTVARVEPSATVTIRSKAFSLARVRFPETRSSITRAA